MAFDGELYAMLTTLCWTGSALAFSAATMRIGSVYVNVMRLLIAIIFLFGTILISGISFGVSLPQIWYLSLSGFVGFVFGDTFLFKSYEYNSARLSSLVMSSAPAITSILGFFFLGERLTILGTLGMLITAIGIALVVLERKETSSSSIPISMAGIFYAFLGAIGQAGGLILAKSAFTLGPVNGFVATLIRASSAIVILAPLNYFAGRFTQPIRIFKNDWKAFLYTTIGSFMGPYLGVTFGLIAISLTDVAIAATIMAMVPIIMLPTVWLLFRERLTLRSIIGACIAVTGVSILFLR